MKAILEVERLAGVCRGFADRHHDLPRAAGMDLLDAVERLLAELQTARLSVEDREVVRRWLDKPMPDAHARSLAMVAHNAPLRFVLARLVEEPT